MSTIDFSFEEAVRHRVYRGTKCEMKPLAYEHCGVRCYLHQSANWIIIQMERNRLVDILVTRCYLGTTPI